MAGPAGAVHQVLRMEAAAPAGADAASAAAAPQQAPAGDTGPDPAYVPEAAAVAWSHSRAWFGAEPDMTSLAYQVGGRAGRSCWRLIAVCRATWLSSSMPGLVH
jgi:hypothetical protein